MTSPHPFPPLDRACDRRRFLQGLAAAALTNLVRAAPSPIATHAIGVTTATFQPQLRATDPKEKIVLDDIPVIVRDELGLRIIDINTTTLGSHERGHIARFRRRVDDAGCIVTNLKVNINLAYDDEDAAVRTKALTEYREWIRAAAGLGARWVRPIPSRVRPRLETWADSYNRLCDHAAQLGIRLLVENYRWIESEPGAIPELIKKMNGRISAQPDTLNWVDHPTRLAGLKAAFPHAASCDFKLKELTANGEHPAFDLKECFDIAVQAGFRGPWCIEHVNQKRSELMREVRFIKAMLTRWTQ